MLSCRDITERASDYLDGDISGRQRLAIRMHIMICRHCRRLLRQLSLLRISLGRRQPQLTEAQQRQLLLKLGDQPPRPSGQE